MAERLTTKYFIKQAFVIHGDKYDYSKVNYINNKTNVIITCPEHGEFKQIPYIHLRGSGCSNCGSIKSSEKNVISFDTILMRFRTVHGNKYNYTKTSYVGTEKNMEITCPEHGEFKQRPDNHIKGSGCPKCNESSGEREVRLWLNKNNISYEPQHKFNGCQNILPLSFDFYLPEHNTCVEYQGKQHYQPIEFFGGESSFKKQQKLDKIKREYCQNNNITLLEIKYNEKVNSKLINLTTII